MTRQTLRLVLLVSCAHALVHVFELSLPSVEQLIGSEFGVGRNVTGLLGTAWRLPFGLGALLAGWLADKYGSKPLLLIYLGGCVATSIATWYSESLDLLFVLMFAMGCFASIYHPAGLAIISRETTPENRGAALGWHGIFGSLGIGGAPFLAAVVFTSGFVSWRQYYLILAVPGAILAVLLAVFLREHRRDRSPDLSASAARVEVPEEPAAWGAYFLLVTVGAMAGVIYGAFVHFLPRYLDAVGQGSYNLSPESLRNYRTALVMLCALVGQALAGRMARPGRLEWQLSLILFSGAPALVWVAFADGTWRVWATCTVAFIHFMSQPIYNSLVAQYVPAAHRSVGYGFSNMIGFGIGALGPALAGLTQDSLVIYGGLAVVAVGAGLLSLTLTLRRNRQRPGSA